MLLLAPPGAGKGTQGERLADRLGVRHVSVRHDQPPEAVTAEILARLPASSPTRERP
jgi:adenylate kinase family enzyme